MSKKRIPKKVEDKILEFVKILKEDKLPITKVFLFGSYAKGAQHKWSDIDVCIVSPKFKDAWKSLQYLWDKRPFDVNYTIEPVGYEPKDFKGFSESQIVDQIKKTGIEVDLSALRKAPPTSQSRQRSRLDKK